MKLIRITILSLVVITTSSCSVLNTILNPFYEPPTGPALAGERSDRALNEGSQNTNTARQALEAMSTYQAALPPRPENPVMQPAVVRLMWVPDRLNRNGDLVPAHYYYLKVLNERWAVTDAFELEKQLGTKGGSSAAPYVFVEKGNQP